MGMYRRYKKLNRLVVLALAILIVLMSFFSFVLTTWNNAPTGSFPAEVFQNNSFDGFAVAAEANPFSGLNRKPEEAPGQKFFHWNALAVLLIVAVFLLSEKSLGAPFYLRQSSKKYETVLSISLPVGVHAPPFAVRSRFGVLFVSHKCFCK